MARSDNMDYDESTPLLIGQAESGERNGGGRFDPSSDPHAQFCMLIGIEPSNATDSKPAEHQTQAPKTSLYSRATHRRKSQNLTYGFTAALSNTLLLSQVVLGATLTALGASESSHVLITVFGVFNTIIAGLVAYLKSRGQPMRARMFRDDLEHVVDEIENSEIMWLGITKGIHGYDEIDVEDQVSVRSEVARLTRLYESAVKKNKSNNPDMYMTGGVLDAITGLRAKPGAGGAGIQIPPVEVPVAGPSTTDPTATNLPAATGSAATALDHDESPATSKIAIKADQGKPPGAEDTSKKDESVPTKAGNSASMPPPSTPQAKATDPDAEPASAAIPPKKSESSGGPNGAGT